MTIKGSNSTGWTFDQDAELLRVAPPSGKPAEFELLNVAEKMKGFREGTTNRACHDRWKRLRQELQSGQPRTSHYWSEVEVHVLQKLITKNTFNNCIKWIWVAKDMNTWWKSQPMNEGRLSPFRPNTCKQQWNARRNRRRWRETTAQKITQSFEESSASPLGVKMEKGEVKIEEELDFMDESESGIEFRKPSLSSSSFQATSTPRPCYAPVTLDAVMSRRRHVFEVKGFREWIHG